MNSTDKPTKLQAQTQLAAATLATLAETISHVKPTEDVAAVWAALDTVGTAHRALLLAGERLQTALDNQRMQQAMTYREKTLSAARKAVARR